MSKKPFYKNIHLILLISAIVTDLLLFFVFMYVNGSHHLIAELTFKEFWRENWLMILQFYAITYFVYYAIGYFNKAFIQKQNSAERFIKEILFITVAGFILQEIFRTVFIEIVVVPEASETLDVKLRMLQMVNVAAILVQYSFMTSLRIYRYLQQKQLDLVRLQKEYTQSQFEALKNQLNPHFLFNSLSALSSLVYVDADIAETFIEKLSKTYRYVLEHRDKEKIELSKEFDFLKAYIFLLKQRFGRKLEVKLKEVDSNSFLIPHSLLIAMEYIVSNNSMSATNPLMIEINTTDNSIEIAYNANTKKTIESSSELQLQHLQERYALTVHSVSLMPKKLDYLSVIKFPFI